MPFKHSFTGRRQGIATQYGKPIVDIGLATSVLSAKQAATQQTMQMKMLKAQHDMQAQLINMIAEVTESAPVPEGVGGAVDKSA